MTPSQFAGKWLRRLTMDRSEQNEFYTDVQSIRTPPAFVHDDFKPTTRKIILLTFDERLGVSREVDPEKEAVNRTVCLASYADTVSDAMYLLMNKQKSYRKKFPRMNWELRLTHVNFISESASTPARIRELFNIFDVHFIEDMNYEE